jgi:hypothetical protein
VSVGRVRWLAPQLDMIPATLRILPWVTWRGEDTGGAKPAKVPYCPAKPWRRASSTAAASWSSFDQAVATYRSGSFDGVGVVLTTDARLVCIDLDNALDDVGADVDEHIVHIVAACATFTEVSPSGLGLHILGRGVLPHAIKTSDGRLEAYSTARYIAMTGRRWTETTEVVDMQPYLDFLAARFLVPRAPLRASHPPPAAPPDDLAGSLLADLERWGVRADRLRRFDTGFLVEIICPWAAAHTTGTQGTAIIIHGSGARTFSCLHAHCAGRSYRDFFRAVAR